jgi:heme-degrading monooxygenase HmoA
MIYRIWHGYTTFGKANAYETLLKEEIFTGISNQQINGYRGIELLRREMKEEIEFITIMWFDSIDSVIAFAGQDYEKAVVPAKAQQLLSYYDQRSQHYEVRN